MTIPGGAPPVSKPTGKATVTAAAGTGFTTIDVSWTAVSGATSYNLYYWVSGLSNWVLLANQAGRTYEHTGLTAGGEYYYHVRGVNSAGNGPASDNASHQLIATTSVPVITLTRVDRTTVKIDWTPTATDAQYDLERRKLHVASGQTDTTPGDWGRLPSGLLTATTYTDAAANYIPTDAESVKYEYRVQARDSDGNNPRPLVEHEERLDPPSGSGAARADRPQRLHAHRHQHPALLGCCRPAPNPTSSNGRAATAPIRSPSG